MDSVSLEDIIRQYVPLPPNTNSKGWYSVLCKVCNDHGRKGPRAGFRFDNETVAYHCFNCGHATVYDPTTHGTMPKKMVEVLDGFGVPSDEWRQVLLASLAYRDKHGTSTGKEQVNFTEIEPQELAVPETFYLLSDADPNDKMTIIARDYLEYDRGVDPDSYPFMLSKRSNESRLKRWNGRLIIPIYKGNKLIYWQGRALMSMPKKYLSPNVPKERIMYGFDKLFEHTDAPLYIVEGWFDAFAIDGIAILGNEISNSHVRWLNRSRRTKVYIPDRFGDGQLGAEKALELGFDISTPDVGSCKDMSEAVKQYGKLYVMKSIVDNTTSGFAAQTKIKVYCKNVKDSGKKKNKKASQTKRR